MPYVGLLLFLRRSTLRCRRYSCCVNALRRASSISTDKKLRQKANTESVNALRRASSISTACYSCIDKLWSVSMPYVGLLLFLPEISLEYGGL